MSVVDRFFEDPLVIELVGALDYLKAETLGEALGQAIEWTRRDTTVDLTAVSSVDSSVMAMMLRVHQAAAITDAQSLGAASNPRWRGCSRPRDLIDALSSSQLPKAPRRDGR